MRLFHLLLDRDSVFHGLRGSVLSFLSRKERANLFLHMASWKIMIMVLTETFSLK